MKVIRSHTFLKQSFLYWPFQSGAEYFHSNFCIRWVRIFVVLIPWDHRRLGGSCPCSSALDVLVDLCTNCIFPLFGSTLRKSWTRVGDPWLFDKIVRSGMPLRFPSLWVLVIDGHRFVLDRLWFLEALAKVGSRRPKPRCSSIGAKDNPKGTWTCCFFDDWISNDFIIISIISYKTTRRSLKRIKKFLQVVTRC